MVLSPSCVRRCVTQVSNSVPPGRSYLPFCHEAGAHVQLQGAEGEECDCPRAERDHIMDAG